MKRWMNKMIALIVAGIMMVGMVSPAAAASGSLPFTDVSRGDWYYSAVEGVYNRGLMTGLSSTVFGPQEKLSRAHFAAVLYRRAGYPVMQYEPVFGDVKNGEWYTQCVMWANRAGVITGYANGNFGPADNLTREQLCTILWRYAEHMDSYDNSARASLSGYSDSNSVSEYAKPAIQWCVATGIFNTREGKLGAWEDATRADCAVMILRYFILIEGGNPSQIEGEEKWWAEEQARRAAEAQNAATIVSFRSQQLKTLTEGDIPDASYLLVFGKFKDGHEEQLSGWAADIQHPVAAGTNYYTVTYKGYTGTISLYASQKPVPTTNTFIVNTRTGVFHRPTCVSVKNMSESNKWTVQTTAAYLVSLGYSPCHNCNPLN